MNALALRRFDQAPEVTEVESSIPAAGEVRVRAASLNGFDLSGGTSVSTMLRSAVDVPAENVRVISIYASPSPTTLDQFSAGTLGKLVITID